ncbi:type III-B CRISPR module RAMP protein Cmr1 [Zoogloea sp.]|uniref:type III-B CRISPR module RAMP protein Cmr1 n=1 Tax=Zoogloea sp. TaxID=49181 RepID=UPI0035B2EC48
MALRQAPPALNPAEALVAAQTDAKSWKTYPCTLVTPMYGGGVKAGVVDEAMPIRASAIRGQLRFWWRLLAIHRDGMSPQAAREREFAVWGGLGTPPTASRVWVQVHMTTPLPVKAEPWAAFEPSPRGGWNTLPTPQEWAKGADYALFPGQGKKPGLRDSADPASLLRPGVQWSLKLAVSSPTGDAGKLADLAQEEKRVHDALRWWACFGGVGARTRRGLGAVKVDGLEPVTASEVKACGCSLTLASTGGNDASQSWVWGISRLKDFRQGKNLGRNPGAGNRPGRSRWPEPDAIRRYTGCNSSLHAPEHKAGNLFPRAAFGLPIIFHFKDEREGDPSDFSLNPVHKERMASPLILRPYLQNGKWFPAALLLPTDHLNSLCLTLPDRSVTGPGAWWQPAKAALVPPMVSRGTDALSAFLKYFQGK